MDAVPIVPPLIWGTKNTTLHELQTGDRSRATDNIDGGRLTARNADVGLHPGQIPRLPMSTESRLREKLRKIEALFAGAGTAGERLAAEAALERVRERLTELGRQDPSIEMQFLMPDQS